MRPIGFGKKFTRHVTERRPILSGLQGVADRGRRRAGASPNQEALAPITEAGFASSGPTAIRSERRNCVDAPPAYEFAMSAPTSTREAAAAFDPLRPKLTRIAYRMLGSVADAEDIVQEAFLRWVDADRDGVREPEAFLRRIVTRLCLNHLQSARRRREIYVGPWLPEPMIEAAADEIDDVTLPLMMALERLSPLERAAFLLYDVFGVSFDEIAAIIGREPAACRQLASRARAHVRAARPRFEVSKERGMKIAAAFFAASRGGDMQKLQSLLAEDIVAYADGGGKIRATAEPITGLAAVMEIHKSLAGVFAEAPSRLERYAFINGLPGFVTIEQGGAPQTTALQISDGKIVAIYVVRNPDKLRHLRSPAIQ
jgi:RNA polymerase sigma-70 factor, ECF subfamily